MATVTRLESLAGVRIPDTPLAKAAVDLLEATSPQFICNHCVRTYVFGNLAVRSIGRSIIDEEIAFCGALLHDLGLVPAHAGENRFEVDGADGAGYSAPDAAPVFWMCGWGTRCGRRVNRRPLAGGVASQSSDSIEQLQPVTEC